MYPYRSGHYHAHNGGNGFGVSEVAGVQLLYLNNAVYCSLTPDRAHRRLRKLAGKMDPQKANDSHSQELQYTHHPFFFSGRRKRRRSTTSTLLTTWELTTDECTCVLREGEASRGGPTYTPRPQLVTYTPNPQFVDHVFEVVEAGPTRTEERSMHRFWVAILSTWEGGV